MRQGRLLPVRVCAVLILVCAVLFASCGQGTAQRERRDIMVARDVDIVEATVPRNATLQGLLESHAASSGLADSIIGAVRPVFDPRTLKQDQPYSLITSLDGVFREFRYMVDSNRFLRVALRGDSPADAPEFDAEVVPYPKEIVSDAVAFEITKARPSLWAALQDVGEDAQLTLLLADAFSGEVDFNSELQDGDRFEVLFDRVLRDGQFSGYEDVKAVTFVNNGRELTAIRYRGPDGQNAWYDAEGRSLKRQFMKSPLKFDPYVTSSFSRNRLHPVLGTYRAHRGVDYRAKYGTNVVSVASGTVVAAGWAGGAGRRVAIRHASGYESAYFHLSAIAAGIRPGARVEQGRVIGRVGNSGTVTATHLHYELKKNGSHVDPVTEHRKMPPGVPIPADEMPAFEQTRDRLFTNLRSTLLSANVVPTSRGQ
ncbi:MAG: M23 family metallopeptidase [Acidobacteria bacterium]|nr:M23 family metallopeptidase [Acidobacteriota bacterium]